MFSRYLTFLLTFACLLGSGLLTSDASATQAQWVKLTAEPRPSSRYDACMAYDRRREVLVLFGGISGQGDDAQYLRDTWEWDGSSWTQVDAQTDRPQRCTGRSMTFNPVDGYVLVWGDGTPHPWIYNGSVWFQLRPEPGARPMVRSEHAVAWDPYREALVIHGGLTNFGDSPAGELFVDCYEEAAGFPVFVLKDTWVLEETGWRLLDENCETPPWPNLEHVIFDDRRNERLMLFGSSYERAAGATQGKRSRNTLTLEGNRWQLRTGFRQPSVSRRFAASWHSGRERAVLFGGLEVSLQDGPVLDDDGVQVFSRLTWEWTGSRWVEVEMKSDTLPENVDRASMGYHAARDQLILFGGMNSAGEELTTMWLYDPEPLPEEVIETNCFGCEESGPEILSGFFLLFLLRRRKR